MIAGSLEHATGTRDIRQLSGLFRVMPVTAISGMLAALSMAGAPPLFGFIGKELLLKAKLDLEYLGVVLISRRQHRKRLPHRDGPRRRRLAVLSVAEIRLANRPTRPRCRCSSGRCCSL
jgi:hypothetical protein